MTELGKNAFANQRTFVNDRENIPEGLWKAKIIQHRHDMLIYERNIQVLEKI